MENALSINNVFNFIRYAQSTLRRAEEAQTEEARRAVLDRQTIRGLNWSLEFVRSLGTDWMNESQLKHACRLTEFRGSTPPNFI